MANEFSITISAQELVKGLRPSKRAVRDSKFLVESKGAVGRDGVLAALDSLSRIATTVITDAFPFPQIFVFTNVIIVCSRTTIYEWVAGSLVSKLVTTAGSTWTAEDFYNYIYLSNGKVAVVRDPDLKTYSTVTTVPTASSICNFNGQVIIGAPDVAIPGAAMTWNGGALSDILTISGTLTTS